MLIEINTTYNHPINEYLKYINKDFMNNSIDIQQYFANNELYIDNNKKMKNYNKKINTATNYLKNHS